MSSRRPVALCVIAKLPRAGTCKTRLAAKYTAEGAAQLSRAFVADTIANVCGVARVSDARAWVAYTPHAPDADVRDAFGSDVDTIAQRGDDFGERLRYAIADLLERGHRAVCVIGSDSPTLPPAALLRAVDLCDGSDRVVLGRAIDGGYYLLGLSRPHPALFSGITWSTSIVATQTIARAKALALPLDFLEPWYDVDEPSDFERLCAELRGSARLGAFPAPATRAAVTRLFAAAESSLSAQPVA